MKDVGSCCDCCLHSHVVCVSLGKGATFPWEEFPVGNMVRIKRCFRENNPLYCCRCTRTNIMGCLEATHGTTCSTCLTTSSANALTAYQKSLEVFMTPAMTTDSANISVPSLAKTTLVFKTQRQTRFSQFGSAVIYTSWRFTVFNHTHQSIPITEVITSGLENCL